MATKKTKRELALEQMRLMDVIRDKAKINMVTCGHCGTFLLHKMGGKKNSVTCFGCKLTMDLSDCPDYWYEGCQDSAEFNEEPKK